MYYLLHIVYSPGLSRIDNLGILKERDAELESLDATLSSLTRDLESRYYLHSFQLFYLF